LMDKLTAEEYLLRAVQSERDGDIALSVVHYKRAYKMKPELQFLTATTMEINGHLYDMVNGNCLDPIERLLVDENDLVPIGKFLQNRGNHTKFAILVMTGALCPVHLMHTKMLEIAKEYVETCLGIPVACGFLSPTHDFYVGPKLAKRNLTSISAKDRLEMVHLVCESSSWISASAWEASQLDYVSFLSVPRHIHNHFQNLFSGCEIHTFYVCGSDMAKQSSLYVGKFLEEFPEGSIIAVSRPGEDAALLEAERPNWYQKFHLARGSTADISSTQIRNKLMANQPPDQLVHPAVADYLYQNKITIRNREKNS